MTFMVMPQILRVSEELPPQQFHVGISTTTVFGGTAADDMAFTENLCGPQSIHRDYVGGTYSTFMTAGHTFDMDTLNQRSIRITHLSWAPLSLTLHAENPADAPTQWSGFDPAPLQLYLSDGDVSHLNSYGPETLKNINFILSAPRWHKIIWNPWHECDNSSSQTAYGANNYAALRHAFMIIFDIIHTIDPGRTNWMTCWLLQAYAWKGTSSKLPSDFYPCWAGFPDTGLNYVDIAGIDCYNEGSLKGQYVADGITKSPKWDSPGACIGIPEPSERDNYQTRYGGTYGYKTTDGSGRTWENGFLGWCEAMGITRWLVGEIGTIVNLESVNPAWCAARGVTNSKADWLWLFGKVASDWSAHSTAKCYALEAFNNAGREFSGLDFLTNSVHYLTGGSAGSLITGISLQVKDSTALPASPTTGQKVLLDKPSQIWLWTGTAWTVFATYARTSWQLRWDEDGLNWLGPSTGYNGWQRVTSEFAL